MDKKENAPVFPAVKIRLSLGVALLLIGMGGAAMKNQGYLNAKAASLMASLGYYGAADSLVYDIDISKDEKYFKDGAYHIALAMMDKGEYDAALERFAGLDGYLDSKEKSGQCIQKKAEKLMEQGAYTDAVKLLNDIMYIDGSRELLKECQYQTALTQMENDEWIVGIRILWSIRDYRDAEDLARKTAEEHFHTTDVQSLIGNGASLDGSSMMEYLQLAEKREQLRDGAIGVGFSHTVGLRKNGTVIACGDNEYGQCDTGDWSRVTQIAAGARHTVGLREDGTVIACGDNSNGQCDVGEWKNVVQIRASDYNTAGLLADGTVVTCGFNQWPQAKGWSEITSISCGSYSLSGIAVNGSLYSTHVSTRMEGEYIESDSSTAYSVGLTQDGLVAYSSDTPTKWEKAAAVFAGGERVGIIDMDFRPWIFDRRHAAFENLPADKAALSISLGGTHFAVLYDDGSVYCAGKNDKGQCDTSGWNLN